MVLRPDFGFGYGRSRNSQLTPQRMVSAAVHHHTSPEEKKLSADPSPLQKVISALVNFCNLLDASREETRI